MLERILLLTVLFFFKQKTAYDMRISDWSSDVCSSDLNVGNELQRASLERVAAHQPHDVGRRDRADPGRVAARGGQGVGPGAGEVVIDPRDIARHPRLHRARLLPPRRRDDVGRSEEHTSELQSLMRISYAVFCLKKIITHQIPKLI